ncbi:lecithin retinol acyltransferase family protein [Ammoniphilus oxalaticus]|nr:lecithin retinol acyltransferase family protein [Ammoniphilus oxalaticus]
MKVWNWWKRKRSDRRDRLDGQEEQEARIQQPVTEPEYQMADHLMVMRLGSSHHGVYVGNDRIIYYNYYSGFVVEDTLEAFAQGARIRVIYSPVMFSRSIIISRCKSRIGERNLQGFSNRSEEFVRWARGGDFW